MKKLFLILCLSVNVFVGAMDMDDGDDNLTDSVLCLDGSGNPYTARVEPSVLYVDGSGTSHAWLDGHKTGGAAAAAAAALGADAPTARGIAHDHSDDNGPTLEQIDDTTDCQRAVQEVNRQLSNAHAVLLHTFQSEGVEAQA